jgi:hypothetical protein
MAYLQAYPEAYQSPQVIDLTQGTSVPHARNIKLPIYYNSVVTRFMAIMPDILGRFFETGRGDIVLMFVTTYGGLLKYCITPLCTLHTLLRYYHQVISTWEPSQLVRFIHMLRKFLPNHIWFPS